MGWGGLSEMSNVKMSKSAKDVKKASTICHVPKYVTTTKAEKHILWTFWMFLVTITCDVKIYIIVCESYCVKLKFLWTSSIVKVFSHVADAPSPCEMPPLLSKAPHPATYPHYAIPTIGLNPSNIKSNLSPSTIHPKKISNLSSSTIPPPKKYQSNLS